MQPRIIDFMSSVSKHQGHPYAVSFNQRSHKCNICGKYFTRKDNLQAHLKMHIEDPQYECKYCMKKFYRRDRWKYHVLQHKCI
ncbi:hypothetical protein TNCT_498771 [Trichonephila clavata]|uniref:C2H2-type domain-containing protein n=1 Tax=Trichonephila clavata TaxID=2740835 RepID=A0A8X6GY11_TRICU|nr:hypothetical protein TNCT_498771 [Trichonephila clavata]